MGDQMEHDVCSTTTWDSNKFLDVRQKFLENRSESTAVEVLSKLLLIDPETVATNAWLEAKDLLIMLLDSIAVEHLLGKNQIVILGAVNHAPEDVVYTIAKFLSDKNESRQLLSSSAVAVAVAFARRIGEQGCAGQIAELLGPIASHELIVQEFMRQLSDEPNSEWRFRIYDVLLHSCRGDSFPVEMTPILNRLFKEFSNNDVLTQLAGIDLLSSIALCGPHVVNALTKAGALSGLYKMLQSAKNDPDGAFLYPGCLKFFGSLCRKHPDALVEFPDFLPAVVDMVRHFDLLDASQRCLAFETFASAVHAEKGKEIVLQTQGEEVIRKIMTCFGAAISSGPVEMRRRHLDALADLFENGNEKVLSTWFDWIGEPFPKLLFDTVMKPFPDLRLGAFEALTVLLKYDFGIQKLFAVGGFVEWLANNNTEPEWEAMTAKEGLVRMLIARETPLIDAPLRLKLRGYFVKSKAEPQVGLVNL